MAYMCTRSWGKECDGCMRCQESESENAFVGYCHGCDVDIYEDDAFKYVLGNLYCVECAEHIEEEDEEDEE